MYYKFPMCSCEINFIMNKLDFSTNLWTSFEFLDHQYKEDLLPASGSLSSLHATLIVAPQLLYTDVQVNTPTIHCHSSDVHNFFHIFLVLELM